MPSVDYSSKERKLSFNKGLNFNVESIKKKKKKSESKINILHLKVEVISIDYKSESILDILPNFGLKIKEIKEKKYNDKLKYLKFKMFYDVKNMKKQIENEKRKSKNQKYLFKKFMNLGINNLKKRSSLPLENINFCKRMNRFLENKTKSHFSAFSQSKNSFSTVIYPNKNLKSKRIIAEMKKKIKNKKIYSFVNNYENLTNEEIYRLIRVILKFIFFFIFLIN